MTAWRVWTWQRGVIDPPEKLDDFNAYMVETLAEREKQEQFMWDRIQEAHSWARKMGKDE